MLSYSQLNGRKKYIIPLMKKIKTTKKAPKMTVALAVIKASGIAEFSYHFLKTPLYDSTQNKLKILNYVPLPFYPIFSTVKNEKTAWYLWLFA